MTDKQNDDKSNKKCYSLGFTLSEVLITLGIIGVVAALTIPTLVNSYQKTTYAVGAEKAYSTIYSALKTAVLVDGVDVNDFGRRNQYSNTMWAGPTLVKYMKVGKDCGYSAGSGCWAPKGTSYTVVETPWYMDADNDNNDYKFITADGMGVYISNPNTGCDTDRGNDVNSPMNSICATIFVDVNGPKGPNCLGRDTFLWYITAKNGVTLYPSGGNEDNCSGTGGYASCGNVGPTPVTEGASHWSKPGPGNDSRLTGRLMEEGWKMNY